MAESRTKRWETAVAKGKKALEELVEARDDAQDKLNLPENLQSSALADKLSDVVNAFDFDIEIDTEIAIADVSDVDAWSWDLEDVQDLMDTFDDAEGADLPLGFGRD